jgi:hypothetical protein
MNKEILNKLHCIAQITCNSFCRIRGVTFIVLTDKDVELLCNPNLQIDSFDVTKHVPGLTNYLVAELRFQLDYYNRSQELKAIFDPHYGRISYKCV